MTTTALRACARCVTGTIVDRDVADRRGRLYTEASCLQCGRSPQPPIVTLALVQPRSHEVPWEDDYPGATSEASAIAAAARRKRDARVVALRKRGVPTRAIASQLRISRRTIQRIMQKGEAGDQASTRSGYAKRRTG